MTQEIHPTVPDSATDFRAKIEGERGEPGHLFIFIGPQTGGKSSVIHHINEQFGASKITTITTREPRPDDDPGSYTYYTEDRFEEERKSGKIVFVDHYGNGSSYGNPRSEVEALLAGENRTLIVDVPHIYELADEIPTIFGDQGQEVLSRTHIFYIGVPSVRDIPIRFEQRQSGRDNTTDKTKARKRFMSRLRSDIHSWRDLTEKEKEGRVTIIRHNTAEPTIDAHAQLEAQAAKPRVPTVHLIINEAGHLEDKTVPAVATIIRNAMKPKE